MPALYVIMQSFFKTESKNVEKWVTQSEIAAQCEVYCVGSTQYGVYYSILFMRWLQLACELCICGNNNWMNFSGTTALAQLSY